MTNLYVPRPFSTPYDTPEQRRETRRRHRHAARWYQSNDLKYFGLCVLFWLVILLPVVVFQ